MQTCSNFQAGSVIRSKNKSAKLEYTGVMGTVCSHDFPGTFIKMRHGERYVVELLPAIHCKMFSII